jgi:hypothetical protein|tara:strand:- start:192 stop:683 length:492 start_codon:yes stop_codon:yes gene_type:complete
MFVSSVGLFLGAEVACASAKALLLLLLRRGTSARGSERGGVRLAASFFSLRAAARNRKPLNTALGANQALRRAGLGRLAAAEEEGEVEADPASSLLLAPFFSSRRLRKRSAAVVAFRSDAARTVFVFVFVAAVAGAASAAALLSSLLSSSSSSSSSSSPSLES